MTQTQRRVTAQHCVKSSDGNLINVVYLAQPCAALRKVRVLVVATVCHVELTAWGWGGWKDGRMHGRADGWR